MKKTDTCGVLYLHGLPGLLGGLAGVLLTPTKGVQLIGIAVSVPLALVAGFIAGQIVAVLGRRAEAYVDSEELMVEEPMAENTPALAAESKLAV